MHTIWQELRFGARLLIKNPGFTIIAIITLALGIGANTAIFSVANAVLLRPLPYTNPERLVFADVEMRKRGVKDWRFSNTDFIDFRKAAKLTFDGVAAVRTGRMLVRREDGTPEQIPFGSVTPNFFRLLGAKIATGRDFTDADGEPQPADQEAVAQDSAPLPTIAILSYSYWQQRYGGSTAIIGNRLSQSGSNSPLVVGVLAPGFELLLPPRLEEEPTPNIWFATRISYDTANRNSVIHRVIGRLKEGATIKQAQAESDAIAAEIKKGDAIRQSADLYFRLEPLDKYLVAEVRPAILALTGAVIFLLLIACANVANLLLVRASQRERELAVRAALGCSWWRLIRQMLVEALLLAGAGTILGLGLAWYGIRQLLAIAPANLPRLDSITIDPAVLAYTALAGLAAAVIFGLPPVLQASRPDLMNILRGIGRSGGLGVGRRLRNLVVVTEVALSFVLLIGSGLMIRSFIALQSIDPGYDPKNMLTFQLLGTGNLNMPQERSAFMRDLHGRLSAIPGVESVTASTPFPLAGGFSPLRWGMGEALSDPSKFQAADWQVVLPGYFETLRTPLIAGRVFTDADDNPERKVTIIDEFLAAKAFPNESAVGKRILVRFASVEPQWVEVIGVVGHQRQTTLAEAGREQVYFANGFNMRRLATSWGVRTKTDPARYAAVIRAEVAKFRSNLLVAELQPMEALVKQSQASTRFSLLLIGVFAIISAILASVGLYGVLSNIVRQRTSEIGVRMALGATPGGIFKLVVGHGLRLSVLGIAAGMIAAFGLTRAMSSMLVGVKATDPVTFAVMAGFFLIIAAIASGLPARRAAGLDPTIALREE
jgi:putative ABC transport system permease protein